MFSLLLQPVADVRTKLGSGDIPSHFHMLNDGDLSPCDFVFRPPPINSGSYELPVRKSRAP